MVPRKKAAPKRAAIKKEKVMKGATEEISAVVKEINEKIEERKVASEKIRKAKKVFATIDKKKQPERFEAMRRGIEVMEKQHRKIE